FPVNSYNATNYWVDIVFSSYVVDNTPPIVSAYSPALSAVGVSIGTSVAATFSEAVDPATISISLRDASDHSLAGAVSYNSTTNAVTFSPSFALGTLTPYIVSISGA